MVQPGSSQGHARTNNIVNSQPNRAIMTQPKNSTSAAKSIEFKPTYFTYSGYVVLGDRTAVEFLYYNLQNTNITKNHKISDVLCNDQNDSMKLVENISALSNDITKAIIMVGFDEQKSSTFQFEKYVDNLYKIVDQLKKKRLVSIILCKLLPQRTSLTELQYWVMMNHINNKIHELAAEKKIQFANIDQALLMFDRKKTYDPGKFYFGRDRKPRFTVLQRSYAPDGSISEQGYAAIASKIDYVISELESERKSEPVDTSVNAVDIDCNSVNINHTIDQSIEKQNEAIKFEVLMPENLRTKPIVSNSLNTGYSEVEDYLDPESCREIISISIPNYIKAPYILFDFNGTMLPALIDSGSPYTIINDDVYGVISSVPNPVEIREIAPGTIVINGVVGKRPVKVIKNVHCIIKFRDQDQNTISVWTTIRIVKGFNTPIILGREFLEVYNSKLGLGKRTGLSFIRPDTKSKVKLPVYRFDEIQEMVTSGELSDPHNYLTNCKVASITPITNMVNSTEEESSISLTSTNLCIWHSNIDVDSESETETEDILSENLNDLTIQTSINYTSTEGTLQNRPTDLTYPQELDDLVKKYPKMFSGTRGTNNLYEHRFVVKPEYTPDMGKHYELPGRKKEEGRQVILDWLRDGTIRHSDSRYRNPLVAVRKADGSLRLCGDYRILNEYLEVRIDQAPNIEHVKSRFGGATIFSSLDFNESFLQIKLKEESMKYTAFLYDGVPYEFTRLPFGTKDSMQGFLAAARRALEGTEEFVAAYVDDILIFSKTKEQHKEHLAIVFEKIDKANMTLKLKKCKFFQESVKFLGFIISREGIKPDPNKTAPIRDFPIPICTRDIQSFLGIVNYYRNHIPYCADIACPLSKLTGNAQFEWGKEQQEAFDNLKEAMCNTLLEAHPRFDREFFIMSDASGYGIGGFIYQLDDNGNPVIINMAVSYTHLTLPTIYSV